MAKQSAKKRLKRIWLETCGEYFSFENARIPYIVADKNLLHFFFSSS